MLPHDHAGPPCRFSFGEVRPRTHHVIETVLDTEDLPVGDRFEWWCDQTSRTLMPTVVTSDHADDFRARIRLLEVGAAQVAVLSYHGTVTVDLLTALIAHHLDAPEVVAPETREQALMTSIRAFIEANLGDAHLTPTAIAAAHHISVRYLHRLFQQQGSTVSTWIRHRRLQRCRHDLAEPLLAQRPIRAVAARWGFPHPEKFSRAFRAAYGMTPRDYRKHALGPLVR